MIPRQLKEIPLTQGLNTKGDHRAQPEQLLDIAVNVEFDDVGGLRCRFPFDGVRTALVGGGTLTNARRLALNGDELLCFTDVALYSWSATESGWVLKGTYLACKVDETPRFVTTGDQLNCDRAELGGIIVYAWAEQGNGSIFTYAAIVDKVTGTVLVPPTAISINASYIRVVALQTKILLVYQLYDVLGGNFALLAATVDPAAPSLALGSTAIILASGDLNLYYDVCRIPGIDKAAVVARRNPTTSFTVAIVTAALAVTTSTKARACDGPCAIAPHPDGVHLQAFRTTTGGHIVGDYLSGVLGDITTNQVLGTTSDTNLPLQIAAAFRSVATAGAFRCYFFWQESSLDSGYRGFVTDAGAITVGAPYHTFFTLASRAFDYNGQVYIWGQFDQLNFTTSAGYTAELQNTYFLYRDDGLLVAKACDDYAGGRWSQGHLPGVALVSGSTSFSFCGQRRRIISTGAAGATDYAQRAPQDITFTFDANEARRCVRLGRTLYITGGELLQYDGARLTEVGFHVFPWSFFGAPLGAGGALSAGGYAYKVTYRNENAAGEIERSTTATIGLNTVLANDKVRIGGIGMTSYTHKSTGDLFAPLSANLTVEVWRTVVNPPPPAPNFFLATSLDPAVTANPNRFLANDVTTPSSPVFDDALADAVIALRQANPENGGVLPAIAPPPATIIAATEDRIFLAGIAGDPDRVWYSRQRGADEVVSFNDALTFSVPNPGGKITAIGVQSDQTVIVWRETATYAFGGAGFDNAGGGTNYGPARMLSKEFGCVSAEAQIAFDDGFVVKTAKGWCLLDRALNYQYIGSGADAFDVETVTATIALTARQQIRILTSARMLVYDTLVGNWGQTSVNDGLDLVMWNGLPAYLTATGVRAELATWDGYAGTDYTLTSIDFETGWSKFGAMQARAIVDYVQLLGELRSTCVIRKRLARDYEASSPGVWNYTTDETWTPSPGVVGSALQVRQSPRYKRCESLKARFTITAPDGVSPLGGPCARLTSIAILFALEPNAYSALGAAQKQ